MVLYPLQSWYFRKCYENSIFESEILKICSLCERQLVGNKLVDLTLFPQMGGNVDVWMQPNMITPTGRQHCFGWEGGRVRKKGGKYIERGKKSW